MKSIEVDEEVLNALFKNAQGFGDTANTVLRRVLGLAPSANGSDKSHLSEPSSTTIPSPILAYAEGPKFRSLARGLDKFLALLAWLQQRHGTDFEEILNLPLGGRKYFAKTEGEIRATAHGSVSVRRIPESEIWALTTLSNDSKKTVISRVLQFLGYPTAEVAGVLKQFPDSEGRPNAQLNI